MPSHYIDYIKAQKKAVKFFNDGDYANAILAYRKGVEALNGYITTIPIIERDKILHHMNEVVNATENIVKCYYRLSLLRKELGPEEFLQYGDSIIAYINTIKNFEDRLVSYSPKQLPTALEADITGRKNFLESGMMIQLFSKFVKYNIHDTVSVKCQSIENLQAYVTRFMPGLSSAKTKFEEIISKLRQFHFITEELVTTATNIFIRKEALVCEDVADQLMGFYHANKQLLAKPVKETLLKTTYECYKKYKTCMDSEVFKTRYEDELLYRQDYLDILSSLSVTVEQFVQINSNNQENMQMLHTVEEYLEDFRSKYYDKLSIVQQLTFLNNQCCIRYKMLGFKRQIPGYPFSNRLSLILANIFSFSRRIQAKEEQFKIETSEIMEIYDKIVKEFLLDKINGSNCSPQIAVTIIDGIVKYLTENFRMLGLQAEDLLALERESICAKYLMQGNADVSFCTKTPHEALTDFIKQLLLRKKSTALVAFSDIFTAVSVSIANAKIDGYGEIAQIFADFTACSMPALQSPKLPSPSQPMAVAPAAVPVPMSVGMEIVGDPPVLQESKKRGLVEEPSSTVAGGTLPMFTHLAQAPERKLPPKKRVCRAAAAQVTTIQPLPLPSVQSPTVDKIQRPGSIPCLS